MADDLSAEQGEKRYSPGKEKADAEDEAGGRAKRALIACWNDGALNYWDGSWCGFTCWRCGAHNDV